MKNKSLIKRFNHSNLLGFLNKKRTNLLFALRNPKTFIHKKEYLRNLALQITGSIENTFFIIAIPGCLHILEICLRYVPSEIKAIIISNGLSEWEKIWIKKKLRFGKIVNIPGMMPHGDVIDSLVKIIEKPFGILDYDCFVFNSELFHLASKIEPEHQLNAFFSTKNGAINLELPETFFLFINSPVYRSLIERYKIDCCHTTYYELPSIAREKMGIIGVSKSHLPEDYKNYFDTLRALITLGIADGYPCNFVRRFPTVFKPSPEIFHVGGVADPRAHKHLWGTRGSYFWRKALECHPDSALRNYYEKYFGVESSEQILNAFPNSRIKIGQDFFNFVDDLTFHPRTID